MNKMVCDIKTGVCGEVGDESLEIIDFNQPLQKVDLYYVTDPICSHCWALEPVLRRFEEEYGQYFKLHTVMGGLLKNWDGFADVKNGIGSPADVGGHWREVGEHSRMPIDGSLWLNDPIQSSYPPSRVFKVIQRNTNETAAKTFLRRAREAVFAFNRNIGEEKVLIDLVNQMGLDGAAIVKEAEGQVGQTLLEEDFALAGTLGVRGFPTIIIINEEKKGVKIVGARQLENYVDALKQVLPNETIQRRQVPGLQQILKKEGLLFSKEIEILYDVQADDVQSYIQKELSADAFTVQELLGEHYIEMAKTNSSQ
jgi:putative protein-disulfide isomerase